MTYSDNRFGTGAIYERLGFNYVKMTSAGYHYFRNLEVFSRTAFQKSNISKKCDRIPYDPTKTELENAYQNGYHQYWNCGNRIFEKTL